MKKIILISVLFLATIVAMGQNHFRGFFKPVSYDTPAVKARALGTPVNVWLFRPAVSLSAVQFTWNKDLKQFNSEVFSSTGMGIGYQHYIEVNGEPYNNFGFNALVLLNGVDPSTVSLAGTVSAFKFVSVGGGYDLGRKTWFILSGVSYSF